MKGEESIISIQKIVSKKNKFFNGSKSWINRIIHRVSAFIHKNYFRFRQRLFVYKTSAHESIFLIFFIVSLYISINYILSTYTLSKTLQNRSDLLIIAVILLFIVLIFIFNPIKLLRVQVKRNQPSWIWYTLWALIVLPILPYYLNSIDNVSVIKLPLLYSILWIGISILTIYLVPENKDKLKRFSFDAISETNEGLGFGQSVNGFIAALKLLSDSVSTLSLLGPLGSGKSSFLRMVIEKLDSDLFLYTYISLTETNEANDFGKLFAERWQETLAERYPTLDVLSATNMLKPILRQNNHSWVTDLLETVLSFNKPVSYTKKKADRSFENNGDYVSEEAAKLFGHVPVFQEDMWIIVIDEIERSKLDEIYRVIEIIERFKSVGSRGLPLKIVFIICTSDTDLKELLAEVDVEPSKQINDFFFVNPKTFNHNEFVPILSWKRRVSFAQKKLQELRLDSSLISRFNEHERLTLDLTDPVSSLDQSVSVKNFPSLKEALDTINLWLAGEQPRLIERVIADVIFMCHKLKNTSVVSHQEKLPFGFTQMIYMSYIRIKYPEIYGFLQKTIDDVSPNTDDKQIAQLAEGLRDKQEKKLLPQWFEEINPKSTNTYDWRRIDILVSGVEPKYKEHIEGKGESIIEDQLTSYLPPDALKRYIRAGENEMLSEDYQFYLLYENYKKTGSVGETIKTSEELYNFATISRRISLITHKDHLEISQFILEWINSGKVKPVQFEMHGDSLFHHLNYEFLFHLNAAASSLRDNSPNTNDVLKTIGQLLTQYFKSENILIGAKMTLLNSLYRDERSGVIHFELDRMLEKLREFKYFDEIKAVKEVFDDYKADYISGNKSVYQEENFAFVLFQYWSGDVNDMDNIREIEKMALKDLYLYPQAIIFYWQQIPYNSNAKYPEDMFPEFDVHSISIKPYTDLKNLIKATRKSKQEGTIFDQDTLQKLHFWSSVGDKGREIYEARRPLQTEVTLVAALKKRGLL